MDLQPVQSLIVGTKMHFNFTYTSTPLLAVKPVQNLSAYTRVHFNVTYTTTPLWTVKPVHTVRACTTMHFNFTYTSTHPIGLTACTVPQSLYKVALYLYLYLSSFCSPQGLYKSSVSVQ